MKRRFLMDTRVGMQAALGLSCVIALLFGVVAFASGCTSVACADNEVPGVCVTVSGAWNEASGTCEATVTFFDGGEAVPSIYPGQESSSVPGACEQCGLEENDGDFIVRVEHAGVTEEQAVSVELTDDGCHPVTENLTFPSSAGSP